MTQPNAAIVEEYAEHLSGRAASSVLSFALVGVAGGAALGAIPGNLSHSLLAHGVLLIAPAHLSIGGIDQHTPAGFGVLQLDKAQVGQLQLARVRKRDRHDLVTSCCDPQDRLVSLIEEV